jgi:hypothetical protein
MHCSKWIRCRTVCEYCHIQTVYDAQLSDFYQKAVHYHYKVLISRASFKTPPFARSLNLPRGIRNAFL